MDMRRLSMIESDSSEKLGHSVDEESQMVPKRSVSLSRDDIKKYLPNREFPNSSLSLAIRGSHPEAP
jgi:hypothetical protein